MLLDLALAIRKERPSGVACEAAREDEPLSEEQVVVMVVVVAPYANDGLPRAALQ